MNIIGTEDGGSYDVSTSRGAYEYLCQQRPTPGDICKYSGVMWEEIQNLRGQLAHELKEHKETFRLGLIYARKRDDLQKQVDLLKIAKNVFSQRCQCKRGKRAVKYDFLGGHCMSCGKDA